MTATLEHRGPDASGVWLSSQDPVALGHTRLAVVDLSPTGAQPMSTPDGRWVIAYNGEIYNSADLRQDLVRDGVSLRGTSDTELLLAGIAHWGLRPTLERIDGMFAFGAWDAEERTLHLVRDRMGEKPLYFGWIGPTFLFGSELRALRAYPSFAGEVDRDSVALMLATGYVPSPRSIYRGIRKLEPGRGVSVSLTGREESWSYWDLRAIAVGRSHVRRHATKSELVDATDAILSDAVRRELVADVHVGALLSGGIDSSLIVAMAQKASSGRVRTFSVGFSEREFDESGYARAVAQHLGTAHTEVIVTPRDAMDVIPDLPSIYDEPFGDSSQIPTLLISRIARSDVTVALTGDGGDELFGGYQRYAIQGAMGRVSSVPAPLRRALASALGGIPPQAWSALGRSPLGAMIPGGSQRLSERARKGASILTSRDWEQSSYAAMMVQQLPEGVNLVAGARPESPFLDRHLWDPRLDRLGRMRLLDQSVYLPDDLLVKVDRSAMSTSLETRAPMLSRPVVEWSWSLPSHLLRRHGQGKWILREVLRRYVPADLFERPKMGFGVPIGDWLRGPLRPWAEDLLSGVRADPLGLVDAKQVQRIWEGHLDGSRPSAYLLWHVLMLQAWRETYP